MKLYDVFVENGRAYLVLEYVNGKSLRQLVEEIGPYNSSAAVDAGLQLCNILKYLHNQSPPVVHRDFSPENLLVSLSNTIKLIDFTVAIEEVPGTSYTVAGKQAYIAPEQFRGKPCHQSDIYSLGAVLYFILTGANPKPLSCSDPRQRRDGLSDALCMIVQRCTALDLRERYTSVESVEDDLRRLSF